VEIPELLAAARGGDRRALARLLTLVERSADEAAEVERRIDLAAPGAFTVGVTGAPGAGKSTLVGALLREATARHERMAVLAIDPSSPFSRGALLGDRVRMSHGLTGATENVFIRSMATRGQQGGLSRAAQTSAALLAACGWSWVILETVGTGQVEVDVAAAADLTLLVMNPGWGDEIQAHKAGIMEIGDVFVINKADRPGLEDTRRHLAMLLASRPANAPSVPVVETIATRDVGVAELWGTLRALREAVVDPAAHRQRRLRQHLLNGLRARFEHRMALFADSTDCAEAVARLAAGEAALPDLIEDLWKRLPGSDPS
jgi:LAO/AO transport system kinase